MTASWRLCSAQSITSAALLILAVIEPIAHAKKPAVPHFKWGQDKDQIFLSVMVRDLDKSSVAVALSSSSEFSFKAKSAKGDEYALDIELREDVKIPDGGLKCEVLVRDDKWGIVTFCVLNKVNQHRWDLFVADPKKYKDRLDRDWTREDQTLEPEEELPYVEDNSKYVSAFTSKNKQKTIEKYSTVLVNVRYPWCSQCKSQDESFIKAAKASKAKGKKDAAWKKVAFTVLDAREERALAKSLGAKCDNTCEYQVFTGPKDEPVTLKASWSDADLLANLVKYMRPAVEVLKSEKDVEALKATNTTCFGKFKSEESAEFAIFKKVAGLMRGQLVFAASFGESAPLELWPHKQNFSFKYDGSTQDNGTALYEWVRPRSIPLLQEYDWQLRETYEKLGLPVAKVWFDDKDPNPSFEKVVRYVVRKVAKQFIGRIAFVEAKKTTYSYELRDFGLNQPEVYPAIGIASNASYNSIKYGFEITSEIADSVQNFWKDTDKAAPKLVDFCEQVLAGKWPQAHESAAVQKDWKAGEVKKIVWKSYDEIKSPEKPLLLELYGKFRAENEKKLKEVQHLATVLGSGDSFTVASYDTSDNFLPPEDFKRDKYSSDTEWYWIPAKPADAARPAAKKLTKPKKDAPIKTVVEFAAKHSAGGINVEETYAKFEKLMADDPPVTPPPPAGGAGGLGGLGGMGGLGGAGGLGDLAALGGLGGVGAGAGVADAGLPKEEF